MKIASGTIQYLLDGTAVSLKIFAVTLIFSIPLGIVFAVCKTIKFKPLNFILWFYTWVLRGTPLMLQLLFVYFGPFYLFGHNIWDRLTATYIAFIVNYAAYFTEIFRGGIQSIDKGQLEAAKALGMNFPQTMRRIIIPQALKRVIPPIGNEVIILVKDTSLAMILAVSELMRNSKEITARTLSIQPYIYAAIIYLVLTYFIVFIFGKVEKRLSYYN